MKFIVLSMLMFFAMGCRTEGIVIGFRDAPKLADISWTGAYFSYPVLIVASVVVLIAFALRGRNKKDGK